MSLDLRTNALLSTSHISLMTRPFGAPRVHMDENAASAPVTSDSSTDSAALPADAPIEFSSEYSAGKYLADLRWKRERGADAPSTIDSPAESADTATADPELSGEDSAAPGEDQAPGENTEADAEAETLPPIERPRSWTKDDQAEWDALPRSRQEKIAAREDAREKEVRRVQNEADKVSKAAQARQAEADQARTQYETKLKSVVDVLEKEQLREFPDIRSQADLDKLSADFVRLSNEAAALWNGDQFRSPDPFTAGQKQAEAGQIQARLAAWNVHQQKLQVASHELQGAETRKATERRNGWMKYCQDEDVLTVAKIPELKDKDKGPVLMKRVAERLAELGFTQDELNRLDRGEGGIMIRDHRLAQLIYSDLKLSDIQKAKTAAAKKPVPPVARPGNGKPQGSADSANIQALTRKFEASGSQKDAFALMTAKREATARRSTG